MKAVFSINSSSVRSALLALGCDTKQLRDAVQSALNDVPIVDTGAEFSAVQYRPGSETREDKVKFKETITESRAGKANLPTQFAAWHDAEAKIDKVFGQRVGLTPPACFAQWLGKFVKATEATPVGKGELVAA